MTHVLSTKHYRSAHGVFPVRYRVGTSDESVLREVIDKQGYARKRAKFDVEPGERWLDLGANIGAFAVYCALRGATAKCYEPEASCFELLIQNTPIVTPSGSFMCVQSAVTRSDEKWLQLFTARHGDDFSRGTFYPRKTHKQGALVPNLCGAELRGASYDGVKVDVEGAEGGLIDEWMLPTTQKLVVEYHLSRLPSAADLRHRLAILRSRFRHVAVPPELDRLAQQDGDIVARWDTGETKPYPYDRLIHCWR